VSSLASALAPVLVDGRPLTQVIVDITAYLEKPSVQDLDFLVGWYERLVTPGKVVHYSIAETQMWDPVAAPRLLTQQGRQAQALGQPLPFLVPVRSRLAAGRPFDIQFWDGQWLGPSCFSYRQVRWDDGARDTFVRVTLPLTTEPDQVEKHVLELANAVALKSGHAGLCFGYNPSRKMDAFGHIYARARRFWGIDVEDLNATLPAVRNAIKGVSWLTLVGNRFREKLPAATLEALRGTRCAHAWVFKAGDVPLELDQHRPTNAIDPYLAVAAALEPLYVTDHPEFAGGFAIHGNTLGWVRRFLESSGWR